MSNKNMTEAARREMLDLLGQRDIEVGNSFRQMDMSIKRAFDTVEFKMAVLARAFSKLGVSMQDLEKIAAELQAEIRAANAEQNGESNESSREERGDIATESIESAPQPSDPESNEPGEEYFR